MYENVCSFNSSIIIVSKSTLVKVVTYKPWTLTKMSHRINEEIIGVVINIKISLVSQIVEHTEIDEHLNKRHRKISPAWSNSSDGCGVIATEVIVAPWQLQNFEHIEKQLNPLKCATHRYHENF